MSIFRNSRNYEKYSEPVPIVLNRKVNNPTVKIAGVLSHSIQNDLSFECPILDLTEENNIDKLENDDIDLLLVESLYFNDINKQNCNLSYILSVCKKNAIRSVFWDTTGDDFICENISLIRHFDYIFTINECNLIKYKYILDTQNVFFLPLAIQPRIHNPVELNIMNKEDIISQKSNVEIKRLPSSIGKIYCVIYKNAFQFALTLLPKTFFEALATGTVLISPYHRIIKKFFPAIINLFKSDEEEILTSICKDKDAIDKLSTLGIRNVFSYHTYSNRLERILKKIHCSKIQSEFPGVTMVTSTNRLDSMENVFKNYENQNYPNKELIVVLNNNKLNLEEWENKAKQYDNVKVFQIDEKQPLGKCLNHAIDNSSFPYFSKCDDDNYYAPNFISDLMNAFKYSDAQIVGKLNYYCYLEGCQTLAMVCPNMEHRYVNMLSGSALIIDREVFSKVRFSNKPAGSDTVFLKECVNKGIIMYSADRFNYVYNRHKSQENHTWKMLDDVFLRSCKVIDITDEYIERVTV